MNRTIGSPKKGLPYTKGMLTKAAKDSNKAQRKLMSKYNRKYAGSLKTTVKKPLKLQYVKADYARLLSAIHKTSESSRFTYLLMPLKFLWSIRWLIYLTLLPISISLIVYGLIKAGGPGNLVSNVMDWLK